MISVIQFMIQFFDQFFLCTPLARNAQKKWIIKLDQKLDHTVPTPDPKIGSGKARIQFFKMDGPPGLDAPPGLDEGPAMDKPPGLGAPPGFDEPSALDGRPGLDAAPELGELSGRANARQPLAIDSNLLFRHAVSLPPLRSVMSRHPPRVESDPPCRHTLSRPAPDSLVLTSPTPA